MPKRKIAQTGNALGKSSKQRKLLQESGEFGAVQQYSSPVVPLTGSEGVRLRDCAADGDWRKWGPYLSERQWGTVREDKSTDGSCWDYFSHDDAIFRAYEYGEDGLMGICDDEARLCLSLALWNEKDLFIKERLFGLTGPQGNHGEDVKELYFYLDSTPTHSYMRALYKYPQSAFPYKELVEKNSKSSNKDPEYEILDTGIFDNDAYWDVYAEYAKNNATDILCQYTVFNRGSETRTIHVMPTLWFRNTWHSGDGSNGEVKTPLISQQDENIVTCSHQSLGSYSLYVDQSTPNGSGQVQFLFTNNETNVERLKVREGHEQDEGQTSATHKKFFKDAINEYIVNKNTVAVNEARKGTKCVAWFKLKVDPGAHATVKCRLLAGSRGSKSSRGKKSTESKLFGKSFTDIMEKRKSECDEFFKQVYGNITGDEALVIRQALAGLCWTKQFYCFNGQHNARQFLRTLASRTSSKCDEAKKIELSIHSITASSIVSMNNSALKEEEDCEKRVDRYVSRRNIDWTTLNNHDIISMPDKWEFPWYATWDLAFHMIPYGLIDLDFAKSQLLLFLSDRYQHPRGQLPAYEFDFSDVNPPVHAWACLKIYRHSQQQQQQQQQQLKESNLMFLKKAFNKLNINFTWWVNQKDRDGSFLFEGGFLGMDNVSCLHRSELPKGCRLKQADGTAWMAFYSLCMLDIALELASEDQCYEDMAVTYLSYFSHIVENINGPAGLWNSTDGFFYDQLIDSNNVSHEVRVRCMIGLTCLFPVLHLTEDRYRDLPTFSQHLNTLLSSVTRGRKRSLDSGGPVLLSLVDETQLKSLLGYALDDDELLSIYGIRALSKAYSEGAAYELRADGKVFTVSYCPAESTSSMFGGNSNWRGPIWLCMNYLLLEALDTFGGWYMDYLRLPLPTKSSAELQNLSGITLNIRHRLISIFTQGNDGIRPAHGKYASRYATDPNFKDLILFYEYFNGDNGAGCGASHQTGWTALIACLIHQRHNQQQQQQQQKMSRVRKS